MSIGDSGISQTYEVDQTPNCYTGTVTLEPAYSWMTLDTSTKTISIPAATEDMKGNYAVNLVYTVTKPTDSTLSGTTDVRLEVPFPVAILAGPPENVCPIYGAWHTVTVGANTYTALTGHASPDDDLT